MLIKKRVVHGGSTRDVPYKYRALQRKEGRGGELEKLKTKKQEENPEKQKTQKQRGGSRI
jgi:hypothetical protein